MNEVKRKREGGKRRLAGAELGKGSEKHGASISFTSGAKGALRSASEAERTIPVGGGKDHAA